LIAITTPLFPLNRLLFQHGSKQSVALTGCNTTGPPWSVGRPTARAVDGRVVRPPAVLQTTTTTDASEQTILA